MTTSAIRSQAHSPVEKFWLLVTAGTSGCQPRTQDTIVTCCLCHTALAPRCFLPFPLLNLCCFRETRQRHAWSLPGLFFHLISLLKPAIPLESSSAQPDPPAHAANVHKIRHSYTTLRPGDDSQGGLQITQKLLIQVELSENQTLLSCKPGPKPQAAQMTTLARKKRSVELIFSPGLQEATICQSFHSNNSFGVDCTRLKDTKRDWAHILQMLSKMWAGGGR